jgi:hypothetical protein
MDVIKCANDEYSGLIKDLPKNLPAPKDAIKDREDILRRRLYSVFLDAFGLENGQLVDDDFTKRVSSFARPLAPLIGTLEINAEGKTALAACLAVCVAAAVEDARDMRYR